MDASNCCQAPVEVAGHTTHYYVCQKCHQPCDKVLKLTCEGCGTVAVFTSADQAFNEGWDCPPHFTQVVTCDKCSSADILLARIQAQQN